MLIISDNHVITNLLETIKSAGNGQENQSIFNIKTSSPKSGESNSTTAIVMTAKKDNNTLPLLSTSLSSPNLCINFDISSSSDSSIPLNISNSSDYYTNIVGMPSSSDNFKVVPSYFRPARNEKFINYANYNIMDCSSNDENDVEEETISGENDVEYVEFSMSQRMPQEQMTNTSGTTDYDPLDDELMLLSLFEDSPLDSFAVQDNNSTATSCELIRAFFTYYINNKYICKCKLWSLLFMFLLWTGFCG